MKLVEKRRNGAIEGAKGFSVRDGKVILRYQPQSPRLWPRTVRKVVGRLATTRNDRGGLTEWEVREIAHWFWNNLEAMQKRFHKIDEEQIFAVLCTKSRKEQRRLFEGLSVDEKMFLRGLLLGLNRRADFAVGWEEVDEVEELDVEADHGNPLDGLAQSVGGVDGIDPERRLDGTGELNALRGDDHGGYQIDESRNHGGG